jgi:hypothetical protein
VFCGKAIYQYEHIDPTFEEAQTHDPAKMTLLCGSCHDEVTRGWIPKELVKNRAKHPKCLEAEFSWGALSCGQSHPEVQLGQVIAKNVGTLLRVLGDDILKVEAPEVEGGPFLISAMLTDTNGQETFRIERNEWMTRTSNWDVEFVGTRIRIREKRHGVVAQIQSVPPSRLVIEKLEMHHKGVNISASLNRPLQIRTKPLLLRFSAPCVFVAENVVVDDALVLFDITETAIHFVAQEAGRLSQIQLSTVGVMSLADYRAHIRRKRKAND